MGTRFVDLLRQFDTTINMTLREIVTDFSFATLVLLMGVSIIYGILHSLGPGHGKALVASYFFKEEHPLRKSMILAAIVSLVHTGTAIILSYLLFYILTGLRGVFRIQLQSYFMIASGIMITVIGVLFLALKIFYRHRESSEDSWKKRNFVLVAISAGMVPCPVSSMIMMLTLSNRVVWIGFITVISISLGMFIVLSLIGFLSIGSRKGVLSLSGRFFNKAETVAKVIEYVSIVFIIFIGIGMASPLLF